MVSIKERFRGMSKERVDSLFRILNVILALCLPLGGYAWSQINENEDGVKANKQAIAVIEGNRFRSEDGMKVWKSIYEIQKDVAEIRATMPNEVPPTWFKDLVTEIKMDVRSLHKDVEQLRVMVVELRNDKDN